MDPRAATTKVYSARDCPAARFGAGSRLHRLMRPRRRLRERLYDVFERIAGGRMPKRSVVSVVEDDQFFRESMRRLMRSMGYRVEVVASAADFLASPCFGETACLIADVNMPVMTGVDLYKHLMDSGHAI